MPSILARLLVAFLVVGSLIGSGLSGPFVSPAAAGERGAIKRKVVRTQKPRIPRTFRPGAAFPRSDIRAGSTSVGPRGYRSVKASTMEILERFPPDRYFYVTVGRSPSGIGAMMDALNPSLSVNIPSSGIGSNGIDPSGRYEAYAEHFDALLPASVLAGGRTLLLIDNSWGNATSSPNRLRGLLQRYLKERGHDLRIEIYSLYPGARSGADHRASRWQDPGTLGTDAISEFVGQRRDGGHEIGGPVGRVSDLSYNVNRAPVVKALKQFIAADAALDAELVRLRLAR